jgi:hypothetical protein
MDSPSSDMPRSAVLSVDEREAADDFRMGATPGSVNPLGTVLIAAFGNPVAAEYAAFVCKNSPAGAVVIADEDVQRLIEAPTRSLAIDELLRSGTLSAHRHEGAASVVLFVDSGLSLRQREELDSILDVARVSRTQFIAIVSSFRVHLGDTQAIENENEVLSRATETSGRVAVFRPGHLLTKHSPALRWLKRLAPLYPLIPRRLSTCFADEAELFAAIEAERNKESQSGSAAEPWEGTGAESRPDEGFGRAPGARNRAFTILGENRPWREMLTCHRSASPGQAFFTAISTVLSWLMLGQFLALLVTFLARSSAWFRQWHVQTLRPRSLRELLSLCHRGNLNHVRVVGYNNGVAHFGHRHPGKTIVSTVLCHRLAFAGPHVLKVDCGATVRHALDFLATSDQDLYVVPNYSYVCLGTAFFVPIHGSAVDYSTIADTITRAVLYDPDSDRIIAAGREHPAFREHVYNQQSRAVLLRLYIRTKAKSRYFVRRETLENPSAADLLDALHDPSATNVEIRQASAASSRVTVARYYTEIGDASSPALELPRDALGRLWDRLEENPITSFLMHALARHIAWHTELFFTLEQFDQFWRTHAALPLRKIQLRFLRQDGLPHSPCRDEDCVSADLFLFRRNRHRFFEYIRTTIPTVRTNPGKHSH